MPTIRVTRLSGGNLDVTVAEFEITQLLTIKDLKICLAAADESKPPASLVQLFEPGKDQPLPADAPFPGGWVLDPEPNAPLLQYVITDDVMLVLRGETRGAPTLHWQGAWGHKRAIEGDWPNTDDGREQPWRMFEPQVGEICWKLGYDVSCGFDGCKEFIDAWKWLAMGLSDSRANEVYPDGTTLLLRILRCTLQWGAHLQAFEFDTLLLDFIQLEKLRCDIISKSLSKLGQDQVKLLALPHGAEFVLALLKKDAGREFWAGKWWNDGDNLLQYILDPVYCWSRRTNINAELCIALAEKFSLREFCHLNDSGFYALTYTESLVEQAAKMGEEERWLDVRETLKANMIRRFREHSGPVKDLAELTDKLWSKSHGLPQATEVLEAFEQNLMRRVAKHLVDKRGLNGGVEAYSSEAMEKEVTDILSEVCQMHRFKMASKSRDVTSGHSE